MSLLEHHPEPEASSRKGLVALIALVAIAGGAAAYFWMPAAFEPAPSTASADPPAPTTRPEPAPQPEPPPAEPEVVSEPEPEPEPEPETVFETSVPESRPEPVLRVDSDVAGASVFLDRKFLGTTPFETWDVTGGPHRLNVSAEGHEGFAQSIEVGNELVSVDVRFLELRLDASVEVVHKHRFGSCSGMLRADLDGVHYETADDDAFTIPLSEIELHAIDYLEHTLTLKRRDGQTYNFTDEQDTADALFVFHRDVEQTRERLAVTDGPE